MFVFGKCVRSHYDRHLETFRCRVSLIHSPVCAYIDVFVCAWASSVDGLFFLAIESSSGMTSQACSTKIKRSVRASKTTQNHHNRSHKFHFLLVRIVLLPSGRQPIRQGNNQVKEEAIPCLPTKTPDAAASVAAPFVPSTRPRSALVLTCFWPVVLVASTL
jgi:hypothetical protein